MSVDALSWAFRLDLPPSAKAVLISLADRANQFGECFSSNDDTERRTGLSRPTITKATELLASMNLLTVQKRFTKSGRQTSNVYILRVGEAGTAKFHPIKIYSRPSEDGESHLQGRGKPLTGGGESHLPPNLTVTNEPSLLTDILPGPASKPETEPPEFAVFWKVYPTCPRKGGRRFETLKAYLRAIKIAPAEKILRGLEEYPWNRDRAYIEAPVVWLNNRRWEVKAAELVPDTPTQPAYGSQWT